MQFWESFKEWDKTKSLEKQHRGARSQETLQEKSLKSWERAEWVSWVSRERNCVRGRHKERACCNESWLCYCPRGPSERTATEVISAASAADLKLLAGDCWEGTGKRGQRVLRWIQGRVSFPTDKDLTDMHKKAEHVLVPLKRLSGKCNSTNPMAPSTWPAAETSAVLLSGCPAQKRASM